MLEQWRKAGVSAHLLDELMVWRKNYSWTGKCGIVQPVFRFVGTEIIEIAVAALLAGENLLLVGAKATGKNVLAEHLFA